MIPDIKMFSRPREYIFWLKRDASPFVAHASSGHAVILCAYFIGVCTSFIPYCNVLFSKLAPLSPYDQFCAGNWRAAGKEIYPFTHARRLTAVFLRPPTYSPVWFNHSRSLRFFLFYFIQDIQVCKPNRFIFFRRIFWMSWLSWPSCAGSSAGSVKFVCRGLQSWKRRSKEYFPVIFLLFIREKWSPRFLRECERVLVIIRDAWKGRIFFYVNEVSKWYRAPSMYSKFSFISYSRRGFICP